MMQRQETQSNKVIGIAFTKSHAFYKSTAQEDETDPQFIRILLDRHEIWGSKVGRSRHSLTTSPDETVPSHAKTRRHSCLFSAFRQVQRTETPSWLN
ncbi:hypothetical protein HZ326_18323 [Fusarium oxysporum f. sp. albedinis]|nr:hypothetical protein HZ326_18323 [Fusarium oxysporum f. sp. albedinis]